MINTAFEVKEEISEIVVSDEDLEALEPAVEETPSETPETINPENVINLDDENVKIVGGNSEESAPPGTEESLEL